jgi:hypothetical protein
LGKHLRRHRERIHRRDDDERCRGAEAFNNVKTKQVTGVIKKTNGHIYEFLMEIMEVDDADEDATLVGNGSDEEDDDDDFEGNDDGDEKIVKGFYMITPCMPSSSVS